jgi:EmrB/QacA subfamily drug resistance transporter
MTMIVSPAEPIHFATASGRWVLVAAILGSGLAGIDATVVNVALPAIGRDLDTDFAALQWTVTAYSLSLASLILLGGSLGDRFGRRRVFVIGVVWFALASLLCGLAPSAGLLIAARALQGVGGALLTPGSLAMIQASFAPEDRGRAIGAWSGLGGVATAIGPFVGGYLVETVSWRWVFLINAPLAAIVVAVAVRHVPETRDASATGRIDALGALLGAVGLGGITYALIETPNRGAGSLGVSVPGLVGVAALVAFFVVERTIRAPMLPLGIFSSRQFSAANAVTFVVYGAFGGVLFLLVVALQVVAGFSPIVAGTALLPVTAMMLLLSARSGALAARIGPRLQMSVGPLVVAAALLLMLRIGPDANYLTDVLPATLVLGLGLATLVAPLTATALAAADDEHAGVASGVNNAVARAAGLLAVAVLPAAAGLSGAVFEDPVRFGGGFHTALLISVALLIAGGALAAGVIRNDVIRNDVVGTTAGPDVQPTPGHPLMHCAVGAPPLLVRDLATAPCSHLADLPTDIPPASEGCLTCLAEGTTWVSLRWCLSCGHVGCCDSSPRRHATAHAEDSGHPVVRSLEPDEQWFYCYVDDVVFELAGSVHA